MRKKDVSSVLTNGLLIGLSAALLWHFAGIWQYGEYLIAEPSQPVLIAETVGLVAVLVFGVYRFIQNLKGEEK